MGCFRFKKSKSQYSLILLEKLTNMKVIAVSRSATYTFTKPNVESINLLAGLGVEGDAHCGKMPFPKRIEKGVLNLNHNE